MTAGRSPAADTRAAAPRAPQARRAFAPWLDPAAEPLIAFRGVTKTFGDTVAVDRLSLDIFPREFFALLGPSGCGKTTLMRLLAGFEDPTEGDVRLGGVSLRGTPPHRRPINMMFQSYALFPHLSVWDNVAFGLRRDGLARQEIESRVDEMLSLVQLGAQARRKPHQLSGGQRQRVALARSLAKRPRVLLLDEPLAALDKKLRGETQFELMNLQEEIGITFLIVTHDQEEAMVLADRIAIMREGRIEQVATPEEIYESPASRYVADFVGDVNLIDGTVTHSGPDGVQLTADGFDVPLVLPPPLSPAHPIGSASGRGGGRQAAPRSARRRWRCIARTTARRRLPTPSPARSSTSPTWATTRSSGCASRAAPSSRRPASTAAGSRRTRSPGTTGW